MKKIALSSSQQSLYFLHKMIREKAAYTISRAAKFVTPIKIETLQAAFERLLIRHAALRTHFFEEEGQVFQRVEEKSKAKMEVFDARELTESALVAQLEKDANTAFELDSGILVRMIVYERNEEQLLLLSAHHIISDFWSLRCLIQELGQEILSQNVAEPFEYVEYEAEFLKTARAEEMRQYWSQELGGHIPLLELPTDAIRPAIKTYEGKSVAFSLTQKLSQEIQILAKERKTTPYVLLMAAYLVLLQRYSGNETVIVGTPMANRKKAKFMRLVSYLVNPVAIRIDFAQGMTLHDLINSVEVKTRLAERNQQYPLTKIIEDLNVKRDRSVTPLFQAMFNYLGDLGGFGIGQAGSHLENDAFSLQSLPLRMHGAQFDLNVGVSIINGNFVSTWEYSTDILHEETILQMARHYERILSQMAEDPNVLVDGFSLLSDDELHKISIEWNNTKKVYENSLPLHTLFENQVPHNRIAVRDKSQALTYDAFNRRANQLAHYLKEKGACPHTIVGVQMERSIDLVIALYAVLKTGAAYLPIAPDYPQKHIDWIVEEAKPIIVLRELPEAMQSMPDQNLDVAIDPESIAYIIYTSGSTGRPKGVMVPHKGITNRILWMQETCQLTPNDVVIQKTPYTFDVSVWEFFWPLMAGASLYVLEPNAHKDPDLLIDAITKNNVTTIHFVPSMLQPFVDHPDVKSCRTLKNIFCSGEALLSHLASRCLELLDANVHNLYGPTEASVDVTSWQVPRNETLHTIPIGRPIANTELYILDRHMQPVPVGVHGELYIGGVGLAKGYLNQPERTLERFVRNGTLYKTGDRCRNLRDGSIVYLGRIDTQVKIRGFRIELEEVEIAACSHALVSLAVAANVNGRLALYFVASHLEVAELKECMSRELPHYMVPSLFMQLEALPMLSSGKVNRKALPEIQEAIKEYVPPESAHEKMLCRVYEEVLGVKQVGASDNFFDLGGDSILVLRAVAKLRNVGIEIAVHDLYTNLPLATVAAQLEQKRAEEAPIVQSQDPYPLSKMQEGLVFHSEYSQDYETYVMGMQVAVELDVDLLHKALKELSSRHPLLRTSFDLLNANGPQQKVHHEVKIPVKLFDISHLVHEEQVREIERFMREEKWKKFVWSEAPFLRLTVHTRQKGVNQFTFSHPLFDGWSMGLLITEFFTIYKGMHALTPAPKLSYRDFVALERKTMQSEESINFWKKGLANMPFSSLARLPSHRKPRPQLHKRITVQVEATTLQGLQLLAKKAAVPLKSVLLAAHMRVVALLTGRQDVTTGLLVNGRPEELEGDKIAGMFLNTVPFRMNLLGGDWIALVQDAFQTESALLPHRRFPLAELVRMHGSPLFETAFNYIHFHIYKALETVPGLHVIDWKSPSDQTYFPLTAYFHLDVSQKSSELLFFLDVDTAVLADEQLKLLPEYYLSALRAMADNFYAKYQDIALVQETVSETKWVHAPFVHELISQYASDKVAIRCNDEKLTYRELEKRSNSMANYLIEQGVGKNTLVAVCLQRSIDLVVALIAVLKTGAAYVPIDPEYPKDRKASMLQDAEPAFIISEETFIDISQYSNRKPDVDIHPEDLAYVIYTSGTTGKPKGVEIPHRALGHFIATIQDIVNLSSDDVLLAVTTISFDIAGLELYLPLAKGAEVVIATRDISLDGVKLAVTLDTAGITCMQATPATWRMLPTTSWKGKVLCGGESMPVDLAKDLLGRGCTVFNLYGPTETTIWSTAWRVEEVNDIIPIGRPIGNTTISIVDQFGHPVPVGVAGELLIGGQGLARGYRNQPELTSQRFANNFYRTGDLARFRPDGVIECLGRIDHQIKLRGFRIELGEIETYLGKFPGIEQVYAKLTDTKIAAYLVGKIRYSTSEMRKFLEDILPHYMIPSAFIFMEQFPLTLNGKIDAKRLPTLEEFQPEVSAAFMPPTTDLEKHIVAIYAEVLGVKQVGIDDNFFDLGGHSLLLVRIHGRLQELLAKKFPITKLFELPTVRKVSSYFTKQEAQDPTKRLGHRQSWVGKQLERRKGVTRS